MGQRPQPTGLPEDQMDHDIDFTTLSLRDTLDLAISVEEEAKERYDDFAEQMDAHRTPEAAKFFRFMAANEIKHAEKLSARRQELFGNEPSTADSSLIYEIEAPEFDEARAFMSVQAALDVAMTAETKAYEFYDAALPIIEDAAIKELFVELRDEEKRHQEMIEETRTRLPKGDGFDPDDFVDAPAGQ
jgi:rubrerythrin